VWVAREPTVETLHKWGHATHDFGSTTYQGSKNLSVAKGDWNPFSDVRAKESNKQFVHALQVWADRTPGSVDDITNQVSFMAWGN
jgi:hypothetical protein